MPGDRLKSESKCDREMIVEKEDLFVGLNQDDGILIVAGLEELLKEANPCYKDAINSLLRKIYDNLQVGFEGKSNGDDSRSILAGKEDLNELITLMTIQTAIKNERGLRLTFYDGGYNGRNLDILRPAIRFCRQWFVIDEYPQRKYSIPIKDVKQARLS